MPSGGSVTEAESFEQNGARGHNLLACGESLANLEVAAAFAGDGHCAAHKRCAITADKHVRLPFHHDNRLPPAQLRQ